MSLWNPYVFTPLGNPIVGEAPPALRVMGGMQATAQQLSYAQQRFTQFVMQARLSPVPNPTEAGSLPDGTRYRIVKVGPQTTMEIWPGAAEIPTTLEMVHGLFRDRGEVDTTDFDKYALKELKEVGHLAYENTKKLHFRKKPDIIIGGMDVVGGLPRYATGLSKMYFQFVRGAAAAYSKYFYETHKLHIRQAFFGSGIAAFDFDGKKRAFIYTFSPTHGLRAIEAKIIPAKQLVKGAVPQEIIAAFGGCPVPPTEAEWYSKSYLVLPAHTVHSKVGATVTGYANGYSFDPTFGPRGGTSFYLPAYSTTADGEEIYFVASWIKTDEEFRLWYSRPVRIQLGCEVGAGGALRLTADASAIKYEGIIGYEPKGVRGYRPGTTSGITAVGVFNDTPTFFELVAEAHTWYGNADELTDNTKITINITGGINEECVIYDEGMFTHTHVSGSATASVTYGLVDTQTTRIEVSGYIYGGISQRWEKTWNCQVTEKITVRGGSTKIITGSDGAIQITDARMDGYVAYDVSVSAQSKTDQGWHPLVSFYGPYPTIYHDPSAQFIPESISGVVTVRTPERPDPHKTANWNMNRDPARGSFDGADPGFADAFYASEELWKRQVVGGLLPPYTEGPSSVNGHVKFGKQNIVVGPTKVYAGDTEYAIDTMAVLNTFETPEYLDQIKESQSLLYIDPLFIVRSRSGAYDVYRPSMWYEFSGLGNANVIAHYNAWNWNTGQVQDRELNYGALGANDTDYPAAQTYFIGKT